MINEEWARDIDKSREPMLILINRVLRHLPKARYLERPGRKRRFLRNLVYLPKDDTIHTPLIPVLISFLENRYSVPLREKWILDLGFIDNQPLFEAYERIEELLDYISPYVQDKKIAPSFITMENVYDVEEILCDLRDIFSAQISSRRQRGSFVSDYIREDDEVQYLDSDITSNCDSEEA
jgi:hypothetical protein